MIQNHAYQRAFWRMMSLLMAIMLPVVGFILLVQWQSFNVNQQQKLEHTAQLAHEFVNEELSQVVRDVKIIAQNTQRLARYAAGNKAEPSEALLSQLAQGWQTIANESTYLDQIRWIDGQGMELLRVNYDAQGAYRVPADQLQHKADRYYVTAGMQLAPGKVYLSPLDLNIENKQIEVPYKPTIRVVTPVIDAQGHHHGLIVVNYLANTIIRHLQAMNHSDQLVVWLLNEQGYWLANPDESKNWGFMLGHPQLTLAQIYPEMAARLASLERDDWFDLPLVARKIEPLRHSEPLSQSVSVSASMQTPEQLTAGEAYFWWLIAFVPESAYWSLFWQEMDESLLIAVLLLSLALFSSHVVARSRCIEAQQKAQLSLAASVFVHANEGIMITDANSVILDANEECCRITGYSCDELVGKTPRLLSSGRYDATFYDNMKRDLRSKGHWYGEIWNRRKTGELYAEFLTITAVYDDEGLIHHYVALFTDITVEKQYQHQLERIAHYDALTDLPNRLLLSDRMQQAMARSHRSVTEMAVIFLDLDGFKSINDHCGHEQGDQILIDVSHTLQASMREGDTLSRFGGDEFIIVIPDVRDRETLTNVIDKIRDNIQRTVTCNGKTLPLSASLGVTFYPQLEPVDAEQLIRQADQAMYVAKQSGKNGFHVFDVRQDKETRSNHHIVQEIERSLQSQEFVLHYQPKVCMATGRLLGLEALIRWQHPEQGLLYPNAFLEFISLTSTSIPLAKWVIQQALRDRLSWQDTPLAVPVSVNLGAMELQQVNFIDWISLTIAEVTGAQAAWLEVEVLETHALSDLDHVTRVLRQLQTMNIKVNLDDFGTGYSSLSYLKHLPLDYIKVDQSFVRQMFQDAHGTTMIEGVLSLVKALGHISIAEGVETEAHGAALLRMGCSIGQGYFIAKPMPAVALSAWLAHWRLPQAWQDQANEVNRCHAVS